MSDLHSYLWLIPALPLAGAVLTAALGNRVLRQQSHWPCILAAAGSCVLSVFVLLAMREGDPTIANYYPWFQAGTVDVGFTLRADALSAVMLLTVTFIEATRTGV